MPQLPAPVEHDGAGAAAEQGQVSWSGEIASDLTVTQQARLEHPDCGRSGDQYDHRDHPGNKDQVTIIYYLGRFIENPSIYEKGIRRC